MRAMFCAAAWSMAWIGAPVFAQSSPGPDSLTSALDGLIRLGPVGICLVLVVIGWFVPKPSVDRLVEALARAEKQRDDLVSQQTTEVLPVLILVNTKVIPALEQGAAADAAMRDELRRLGDDVRLLTAKVESGRGMGG